MLLIASPMNMNLWLILTGINFLLVALPLSPPFFLGFQFVNTVFFKAFDTFRGADWRGRDCNGFSNEIYPGRKNSDFPDAIDHDCNGIAGRDHLGTFFPLPSPLSPYLYFNQFSLFFLPGRSYEQMYCSSTDRRGYIGLGDSATAHFAIPPQWITAADINKFSILSPPSPLPP